MQRTTLGSGLKVVSEHVPSVQSVAIGLWVNHGSRDEAAPDNGTAHFIEHAVFKGTMRRKAHQIASGLESVGGYLNAFTAKDSTCFYARVPAPFIARAVELLSDLALHPRFAEPDIEKEKRVIIEEMRSIEDDPEDFINDHLEGALFGRHALGRPIIGTERSIGGITRDGLFAQLRANYVAPRMVVTAAGAVDHDALARLCETWFTDAAGGRPRVRRAPGPAPASRRELSRPGPQAHLLLGTRVPGLRHPDNDALLLLNLILGENMSSRLFQRVRERHGCTYNIYSALSLFEDCGVLSVYMSTDRRRLDQCRRRVRRELEDLRERRVADRELDRARTTAIGGILMGLESMSTRMNRLGRDEVLLGGVLPLHQVVDSISSVSRDDILRVAAYACDADAMSEVVILPDEEPVHG